MTVQCVIILVCFLLPLMGSTKVRGEEREETINWKTHMEFSYVNIDGTTRAQTLSGKLGVRKEDGTNRYFVKGNIQYGEDYDNESQTYEETVNKWSLDGRYEKTVTEKSFGFLSVNYSDDKFSGYDYRVSVGPGFGYDFVKMKRHTLKGLLSTLYSYDRFTELQDTEKYDSYGSGKVAFDYVWRVSQNVTLKEMADYSRSFELSDKYFINSETALEMKVNTFISLGLSYIVAYQNDILSDTSSYRDIEHTDKTFLTSIIIDL